MTETEPLALELISQASAILASSLDYTTTLRSVAERVVNGLASGCTIDLVVDGRLCAIGPAGFEWRLEHIERTLARLTDDPELRVLSGEDIAAGGFAWIIAAPMCIRGEMLGHVCYFGDFGTEPPSVARLMVAREIALRAAVAVDTARLWGRERHIADTLQRALLPDHLPQGGRHAFDAAYLPASADASVGGDWYDAFSLPDGRVAFSIGDVAGHGLQAAVVMGEVRQAFRAAALNPQAPSTVLERANTILNMRQRPTMVTAVFGIIDPVTSTLTYATAGHPPPILGTQEGRVTVLPSSGLPLGIGENPASVDWTFTLPPASLLVLYTDGLIEFGRDPLAGEAALVEAVRQQIAEGTDRPARSLQARVFGKNHNTDDVATLTISVAPVVEECFTFTLSAIPLAAPLVRSALVQYAHHLAIDADQTFSLITAVGEAVANAVEHAYAGVEPGIVRITAAPTPEGLAIHAEDFGRWRPAQRSDERGRGIKLMRQLMDAVEIETHRESTNVRLTMGLRARSAPG